MELVLAQKYRISSMQPETDAATKLLTGVRFVAHKFTHAACVEGVTRFFLWVAVTSSMCAWAQTPKVTNPFPLVELQWHESGGDSNNADDCAVVFGDHTYQVRWMRMGSERGPRFGTGQLNSAQVESIDRLLQPGVSETLPSNHAKPSIPEARIEWLAVRVDRRGLSWRKSAVWFDQGGKTSFPPEFSSLRSLLGSMVKDAKPTEDLLPGVCTGRLQPLMTAARLH